MATRTPEELVERLRAEAAEWRAVPLCSSITVRRADADFLEEAAAALTEARADLDEARKGAQFYNWRAAEAIVRAEAAEAERDRLREALSDLWTWATEARTHLTTDPVPDGLGAQVLSYL